MPPIVHVSADGTTGWVIAQVRVEGTYRKDTGVRSPLDTTWSWVELYERADGVWRRTGIASTHDRDAEPAGLAGLWHAVDTGAATVLAAAEVALGGRPALAAVETLRTEAAVTMSVDLSGGCGPVSPMAATPGPAVGSGPQNLARTPS